MDLKAHRRQVALGLQELERCLERLIEGLAHSSATVQIEASESADSPLRQICAAYSAIDYRIGEEAGSSTVLLGVAGVGVEIQRHAEQLNIAKAKFKAICSPLQSVYTRIPVKGEDSPTQIVPVIRVILRNIQRSDLSLLAAYRKIPLLEAPPSSITYTNANTRSVYKKSIDDIYTLLNTMEGPSASADRARLSTLSPREFYLALVKERYPNVRANIVYARLDARGRGRIQIAAELPILYSKGRRDTPVVRFPCAGDELNLPQRQRRSKIESRPFLESLPIYRYASRE